ncbi:DUF1937 family protein [Pseudoroseicyclus aestuarii]|uniref:Uncharacterized protein DUF1937 n=1 Tax=Pseudoroseicyclus aestuarii TaxID=1795041 RepID=A0A318T3G9_9RHOB|nr:DUF1937 family protein [Pseudoroseicyclus aestuarii]PYE80831.1 uncharacterized protein DUF1937 [Pseudoroseicyclus aestuarii]
MNMHHRLPPEPDWTQLCARYEGSGLLRRDVDVDTAAKLALGCLGYLSVPCYTCTFAAPKTNFAARHELETAAMAAAIWSRVFARHGARIVSPVVRLDGTWAANDLRDRSLLYPSPGQGRSAFLLRRCDLVVVPPIDGWRESVGVWRDACWALERNMRVLLIQPNEEGL